MKKLLAIITVSLVLITWAFAYPYDDKCGTMEYLEMQKQQNSNVASMMEQFEVQVQQWISDKANSERFLADGVITIPVVVHILYCDESQNISDQRVFEQIAILNRDFAGQNPNSMGSFPDYLKANTGIQFELAKKTPDGKSTTGIERRKTSVHSFSSNNDMKYGARGGLDAWDPKSYMNIWVCILERYTGYAQFPGTGVNSSFGVVIRTSAFGLTDHPRWGLGGVTSHEIGHCFNLRHVWGDDQGACTGDDFAEDVPNQAYPTYDFWQGTFIDECTSSKPGIMYMNFMDYTNDASWANFTPDQTNRIQACFAPSAALEPLKTSTGAVSPTGCEIPTSIFVRFITKTTATLEWNAMYGALSYYVRYRVSGGSTWIFALTYTNNIKLTGLSKNKSYEFQVQTISSSCTSEFSPLNTFKTPNSDQSSSIATPTLINPVNNAQGVELQLTLSWSSIANSTYRVVQYSEFSDFSNYYEINGGTTTIIAGLDYGKTYYWRVKGCNSSYSGPWSETRTFSTLNPSLPQVTLISPIDGDLRQSLTLTFSWNELPNVQQYVFQYSTDRFANYNEIITNDEQLTISNLSPITLYYWRVKGINGDDFGPWAQRMFITGAEYPDGASLQYPEDGAANIPVNTYISWSAADNADCYVLQYSVSADFSTVAGGVNTKSTSVFMSELEANKTYYWRVKVYYDQNYGNISGDWSEPFSFTTGSLTLATPTLLLPQNNSLNVSTYPILSWNNVDNAIGYYAQYSSNSDMTDAIETYTVAKSWNLSELSYETIYYWRVKAVNGDIESDWSSVWNFTTQGEALDAPLLSTPTNNSSNVPTSLNFNWESVSGATYYTMQYSLTSAFSTYTEITPISGTTQYITGLGKNKTYYWRVKAYNENLSSDWSAIFKFKTSPKGKIQIDDFYTDDFFNDANRPFLRFYPNPAGISTYFEVFVPQTENLNLEICDVLGRKLITIFDGISTTGTYNFDVNLSNLSDGVYYCRFTIGEFTETHLLLIIR